MCTPLHATFHEVELEYTDKAVLTSTHNLCFEKLQEKICKLHFFILHGHSFVCSVVYLSVKRTSRFNI